MHYAYILATKIPQKVFIRIHRLASCEVIDDIWEMEKEGDRIDEDDRANE
jgi:hypothetical protein